MAVVPEDEPSYEDDDYIYINLRDPRFEDIYNMWRCAMRSAHSPMILDRMELEAKFFTGSDFRGNNHGFNMNSGMIYPEQTQKIRRRSTSNGLNNLSVESLVVSAKRVSELMQNEETDRSLTRMLVRTYRRMGIMSNNDLHLTLCRTRDDENLEKWFMNDFDEASGGYGITGRHICFFRNTAMYMNIQWNYDHEYFQRMIERDIRINPEIAGERVNV